MQKKKFVVFDTKKTFTYKVLVSYFCKKGMGIQLKKISEKQLLNNKNKLIEENNKLIDENPNVRFS